MKHGFANNVSRVTSNRGFLIMSSEDLDQVRKIVEPIIEEANLELFDLLIKIYRGVSNIELLIDRPNGGISIEECAKANRKIANTIEEDGLFGDDYTVSVSSPGLDWPLTELKDFKRLIGQDIDVSYEDGEISCHKTGVLQSVTETNIVIKTLDGEVEVLLLNIKNAFLLI